MKKIILASGSPRRKLLLEWAEIDFEVMVSDSEESFDKKDSPENIALKIASKKNIEVIRRLGEDFKNYITITADTIVVLNGNVIGKPIDREDAINILSNLSGKTHEVITAVDIRSSENIESFYDKTLVEFHHLEVDQIVYYVDHYKPFDKAGAYAIQEWIGVTGIKQIKGDFYNVMGLPVSRVVDTLKKAFL